MKKWRLLALLTATCLLAFTACGNDSSDPVVEDEPDDAVEQIDSEQLADEIFSEKNTEGMVRSYLTGDWVEEEVRNQRPLCMMIENDSNCVPQYGIGQAAIIVEAPVEVPYTRLMAIFDDYSNLDKVGNIRSARPYYINIANEINGIFMHFGYSADAEEMINAGVINNLNGLTGPASAVTFYRTSDRKAPYNVYSDTEKIVKGIEKCGYDTNLSSSYEPKFLFSTNEVNTLEDGEDCKGIEMYYVHNSPWFTYNEEDHLYYRYQLGGKHIDAQTGDQLSCKNIIIQDVDNDLYANPIYLNIHLTGSGTGKFITEGKMIDITWEKPTDSSVTHYFDKNGNEIQLNVGQTWLLLNQNSLKSGNAFYSSVDDMTRK